MFLEDTLMTFALQGAGWVLWLLVILSFCCIAVAVERGINLVLNTTPSGALQSALATFVKVGDAAAFRDALDALRGLEARVLAAGMDAAAESGVDAAEEAIAGTMIFERSRLGRRLIILGTTGSNAPFIGLFGTVLGIIKAFHDLASNQAEAADAVMAGISEALVATAVGLMVAIPAVVLYNLFQSRNKTLLANAESLSHLALARLKATTGSRNDHAEAV
jgi:biopolymer transport protein ExbB